MHAISSSTRVALIATLSVLQLLAASPGTAQKPVVSVAATQAQIPEPSTTSLSGSNGSFQVVRSIVDGTTLTINYTVSGSATPGSDYASLSGSITLGPNVGGVLIPINVFSDAASERDETITVTLQATTRYNLGTSTATTAIIDLSQQYFVTRVDSLASEPSGDNATVTIERRGTVSEAKTVSLVYTGSASNGTDYTAPSSVSFPAGQSTATITITPLADAVAEGNESIVIATSDGTTLGSNRLTLVDAVVTVAVNPANIIEAQGNTANFIITRTGNLSGNLPVPFTIAGTAANGTDYNSVSGSVAIASGAASANVAIVVKSDSPTEGAETVILTLSQVTQHALGTPNSATLVIQDNVAPTVSTFALSAATVIGGGSVTGTVTLNGPAPAAGIPVTITSTSTAATVPATLTIASGQSSGTFTITTTPRTSDATATISVAAPTGTAQTKSLTVQAAIFTAAALNKSNVTPQALSDSTSVTGTVTLTGPAPAGGTTIQLSSNAPSAAAVPASVVIAANQTSATFKVTVVPLAATVNATITATRGAISKTMPLAVKAPTVSSLTFNPATLAGGPSRTTIATAVLDGVTPAAGLSASFTDDSDRLTSQQPNIFFSSGATSGTATFAAQPVATLTTVTVTAALAGTTRTGTVTLVPPTPQSMTFNDSTVVGGVTVQAQVQLNGNAPVANYPIAVSSSSPAAFPCSGGSPISSITFGINAETRSFSICTQPVAGSSVVVATITAGQGASAVSVPLELRANTQAPVATAASVVLTSTDITAGTHITGTVTVVDPNSSGAITIASNNPAVTLSPNGVQGTFGPTTVVGVGAGQSSAGFHINTAPVGKDTLVTISATPGTASQGLMVRASVLTALNVNPSNVAGGSTANGNVQVSGPAPSGGFAVQLSSDNPAVTVPSVVTIFANSTSASFTVSTTAVPSDATATITATLAANQRTKNVTVLGPIAVSAASVSPATVLAGNPTTLTLTLNTPAPANGTPISLSCSSPNVQLPSSVTVPSGQTTVTVPVTTLVFGANSDVTTTISATLGGTTRTAQLVLQPVSIAGLTFSPVSPVGGVAVTATLQLNRVAPGTGTTLALVSSDPSVIVPASVTIAAGQVSTSFNVTTTPVASNTVVTVSATFDQAVRSTNITVRPPDVSTITIAPSAIVGGTSATGTVNLNANAPTGGLAIAITPNPSTFVTVPTTVTVPATQSSVTFSIAVSIDAPSGVINFGANRPGGGLASKGLTVQSAGPTALSLSATSVQGGQAVTATMNLGGPAALAFTMPISSNNPTASVPASLSINTGVATPQFTIQTSAVTSATTVTITAGAGANAKTATLTITP